MNRYFSMKKVFLNSSALMLFTVFALIFILPIIYQPAIFINLYTSHQKIPLDVKK